MRSLKKITFLTLVFCLSFALFACANSKTAVEIPETEDIQTIRESGVLRVGVKKSVEGFGYKSEGKYTGLEVDLAKKLADDLGVEVEYTSVTPTSRQKLLEEGKIDCVLATYTITEQRKKMFDFSTPYYKGAVSVLVDDENIHSLADLENRVVGVVDDSASAYQMVSEMIDQGLIEAEKPDEETFDPSQWNQGVSFVVYPDYTSLDEALRIGDVDGFCVDTAILKGYTSSERHLIKDQFANQSYGVATKKGSGLSSFVDDEIKAWKKDGSIEALKKSYDI